MTEPSARDELAQWRAQGRMITTDAGEVFARFFAPGDDTGHEPLLVLHGFPSCSLDWRHVADALAVDRGVLCFDFIGFGLSAKPDRRYSIELHADTAVAVAAALGLERLALLTHDMGDTVGGELLARDLDGALPFAISRRVLTNGSIYLELAHLTDGQQLLLHIDDAPTDLITEEGFSSGLAQTFAPGHPASADELALQWAAMAYGDGDRLLPRLIRYLEDRKLREARYTGAIERHPSPLGVVWGMRDPVAVPAMVDRLLAARPGTPLVPLAGAGHYPMIEVPEAFARAVSELLDASP
jgi:pimeloyl-ACP methyl ester carboxylesterase